MLKFSGSLTSFKLDVAAYKKALDDAIQVQIRQAARAWLRAVIPAVPVWTGTARGSLQPLGRYLKVAVPITPVASRAGMGPGVGEAQGRFTFTRVGSAYQFSYTTDVVHYMINEFHDVSPPLHLKDPGPWASFEKGDAAFRAYVATVVPRRLPKIDDFLVATQVALT